MTAGSVQRRGALAVSTGVVLIVGLCALLLTQDGTPASATEASATGTDDEQGVRSPVEVDDPLVDLQWYLERIRAPQAWATTRGSDEVTIGIVDTGVDLGHRDLDGAFWRHPGTGRIGFDHLRNTTLTYVGPTEDWHGTAVAGIAAARADDGHGIAGVAPEVRIMVHRIYASEAEDTPPNQGSYGPAIRGIEQAVADGADVLLLTWGGTMPSAQLVAAVQRAGVPVVTSAGNDGQDLSNDPEIRRYPALYRSSNLVTVAASDRDNGLLANERLASNWGVRHVDLAAPGLGILSLTAGGGHRFFEGTSFAAPQVAGALALGRSVAPGVSASGLVSTLVSTTRPSSQLSGLVTSGGVLDVEAFLASLARPACSEELPPRAFGDVPRGSTHVRSIDCISWYGVTRGTGEDRFAPQRTITRGEMATFLQRLLRAAGYELPELPGAPDDGLPGAPDDGTTEDAGTLPGASGTDPEAALADDGAEQPGTDAGDEVVPTGPAWSYDDIARSIHAEAIETISVLGIAGGVGDGRFAPDRPVTRAQMGTFVLATVELLTEQRFTTEARWFDDVAGSTHERAILVSRDLGITRGTGDTRIFDPTGELTRAQMASFLAQTMDALGRQGIDVEPLT